MIRNPRTVGFYRLLGRSYATSRGSVVSSVDVVKSLPVLNELEDEELERSDVHRLLNSIGNIPSKQLIEHINGLDKLKDGSVGINLQLKRLVDSNDTKTFRFILENITKQLDHDLLDAVLMANLDKTNFNEMVQLLEVLIYKQKFYPSNNLWSKYISLTGQLFSFEGARLIVHNVIDKYTFYDEGYSAYNCKQTEIPFVVTPKTVETLGLIFQKNGLPDYIIILRDYLKRFFSLYTERDVLKSLSISLVEAYSNTGDIKGALWSFRYLCMLFKDHYNFKPRQKFLEELHSSFHDSYTWRQRNIESNQYRYPDWPDDMKNNFDKLQDLEMQETNRTLYRPIDAKSIQTRVVPIFEGKLHLTDIPLFTHLINRLVLGHMESQRPQKMAHLMKIVKTNHHRLSSVIAHSLTSNDYFEEALMVLSKMRLVKPDLRMPVLFSDDLFLSMFKECNKKINLITSTNLFNMDQLLRLDDHVNKLIKIYFNVNKNSPDHVNPKVMATYLSFSLKSPRFQNSLVQRNLMTFMKMYKGKIYLNTEDYDKFCQAYDLDNSVFKDYITTRL